MNIQAKIILLLVTCVSSACSNSPGGSSLPSRLQLGQSHVQKGPFSQGSTVNIQELDISYEPTGKVYGTKTTDDLGSFSFSGEVTSPYVEIITSGFYYNEVAGKISDSPLTVRVITDLTAAKVNINILTTLAEDRIKYLIVSEHKSYLEAKAQAEREILGAFQIPGSIAAQVSGFESLDISQPGTGNAILLAISAILQGDRSVGELSEFTAKIASDLRADGTLDNADLKSSLVSSAQLLKLDAVRTNLGARYRQLGLSNEIPPFEDYVDSDGDGVINAWDYTLLSPPAGASANSRPTFGWTSSRLPGAEYHFQLSSSPDFTAILEEASHLEGTSYALSRLLADATTYYWRVLILGDGQEEIDWAGARQVAIDLGTVEVLSPSATTPETRPIYSWRASPLAAARYNIEVAEEDTFSTIIDRASNLTTTSYPAAGTLQDAKTYFIRVAVVDANEVVGAWSAPYAFLVDLGTVEPAGPFGTTSDSRPTYAWSPSPLEAVKYNLEVAADAGFSSLVVRAESIAEPRYLAPVTLENLKTYHYRVAVIDANGVVGRWSGAASFGVDVGTVVPTGPVAQTEKSRPTYTWAAADVPGAHYNLQVAADAGFAMLVEHASDISDTSYPATVTLENLRDYYFRVATVDSNGVVGQWGEAKQFRVDIGSVVPQGPSGNINDSRPVFSWSPSPLAMPRYALQISKDPGFANIVEQATEINGTSFQGAVVLENNSRYYFRVAVLDANGVMGKWSTGLSFVIDLGSVFALSPDAGFLTNDVHPRFQWTSNPNAATYTLVVSTHADLSLPVAILTGLTQTSHTLAQGLAPTPAQTYYWSVIPKDEHGGSGNASEIRGFVLDTVAPTGTLVVNDGDLFTARRLLQLSVTADDALGVEDMRLAESEQELAAATYVPFATSATLDVSAGNGAKSIFAQFKDLAGNESSTITGSINLEEGVIYVSPAGDDAGSGTRQYPRKTLQAGVDAANGLGGMAGTVKVAEGLYELSAGISLPGNLTMLGGYSSDWSTRDGRAHPTRVRWDIYDAGVWYAFSVSTSGSGGAIDGFFVELVNYSGGQVMAFSPGADTRISNNVVYFDQKSAGWEWGVWAEYGAPKIFNNMFYFRGAGRVYGAKTGYSSTPLFANNGFVALTPGDAGIFSWGSSHARILNNVFHNFDVAIDEYEYRSDPAEVRGNLDFGCQYFYHDYDTSAFYAASGVDGLLDTLASLNLSLDLSGYLTDPDGPDGDMNAVFDNDWSLNDSTPASVTEGGIDLSAEYSTDMAGNPRTVPWSIGAYEK